MRVVKEVLKEYPIIRGMISYSILYPIGSIIEQTFIEDKNIKTYNYVKCAL